MPFDPESIRPDVAAAAIKKQIQVFDKEPVQVANQDLSLIPFQLKTTNVEGFGCQPTNLGGAEIKIQECLHGHEAVF